MNRNHWMIFGAITALLAALAIVGLRSRFGEQKPISISTSENNAESVAIVGTVDSMPVVSAPMPDRAIQRLNEGRLNDQADVEDIYRFLCSHGVPSGMTEASLHAFKSGVMSRLQNNPAARDTLSQALVSISSDRKQDPVIRDYAVQHFASWYPDAPDKEMLETALWSALEETGGTIAGSALLGLMHLTRDWPEQIDRQEVERAALKMAGDKRCEELSRTTALQVCGQMALEEALPLAEQLAETATSVTLRTAAIATLADLGGQEAIPVLRGYAENENPRLAMAGRTALERLVKVKGRTDLQ